MSEETYVVFRLNSLGLLKLAWSGSKGEFGEPLFHELHKLDDLNGIKCTEDGAPPLTCLDRWRLRKLRSYRYRTFAGNEAPGQGFWSILGVLGWWMFFLIRPSTVDATSAVLRSPAVMAQPVITRNHKRRLRARRQSFLAGEHAGGVGVGAAWSVMKGRGEEARVILLDLGCASHEQLPDLGLDACDPRDVTRHSHGVSVLGLMGATKKKGRRTRAAGICHGAQFKYRRVTTPNGPEPHPLVKSNLHDELWTIGACERPGTVVVLPLEATTREGFHLPVEYAGHIREAIVFAVGRRMHVIQSAGNGVQDLRRHIPACADSGSIVVGSGSALAPARLWNSNYGSRVDLHAWGHDVASLSLALERKADETETEQFDVVSSYTDSFGATSAATAITAGVVASLVSILGYHLTVAEAHLRRYRHDEEWDLAERAGRQVCLLKHWSKPCRLREVLCDMAYWRTPGIGGRPSLPRALAFLSEQGILFYSAAGSSTGMGCFGGRPWRWDGE